jgi:hypothetical protein
MYQPFMPNFVKCFRKITEYKTKTVIDHDLKELDEWSKKWLMSLIPDKTAIMLFPNTNIPDFNFTFNGRTIPITNSHKHLNRGPSTDITDIGVHQLKHCKVKKTNCLLILSVVDLAGN